MPLWDYIMTSMYNDTYFVLDFDRCIGDTNGIQALLEQVLEQETGIHPDKLATTRQQIEAAGHTFETIRHVKALLKTEGSSVEWEHIRQKLLERSKNVDLLLPGAHDLLTLLQERGLPHGIITYGVEEAWQLTKLELAGLLNIPYLVTHIEAKGELLTGWKRKDGLFLVPPALTADFISLSVKQIIFLDDKAKSFRGIPAGVRGVHIEAPGGNKLPAQQGDLPSGVTSVTGIPGAIRLLFK